MEKKTVAVVIMTLLISAFIICSGATVSAYKVAKEKVSLASVVVKSEGGIIIVNEKDEESSSLKVHSSAVGVRPATGEEDNETSIPSTVNDAVGTEGAYSVFKITSKVPYKIILNKCSLSSGENENLKNVRVAIMEKENEPICGCDKGAILATGEACEKEETVLVVWLSKTTTKSIKGAKISVELTVAPK